MIKRLISWLSGAFGQRAGCDHHWRPCVIMTLVTEHPLPGRKCQDCHTWEQLSDRDFYALFGENFFAIAKGTR